VVIDWNNKKRKALRRALQETYPNPKSLEMFFDEELSIKLSEVAATDNLEATAYDLVTWAQGKRKLDEVYAAFKNQNSEHPVIKELEWQSFVPQYFNLSEGDWNNLFAQFFQDDLADLQRAFLKAFHEALGITFQQAQPQHSPLVQLSQIRELLESYDVNDKGPVLAVRFVEWAISELQRSNRSNKNENRNFTILEQWRDRISNQYSVPLKSAEVTLSTSHSYLLVVLEECGADVNVYPELHITGIATPIGFGAQLITCSLSQVADLISQWIKQAEETVEIRQCEEEEVTLELFLPCKYMEEDVAMWSVKNKRGDEVLLGTYRRFLVRSLERIQDRKIQKVLAQRWQRLEECVESGNGCSQFHLQEVCPEQQGALAAVLTDVKATGLELIANLPSDSGKRRGLLYEIIDAAIPIALWSSEISEGDADILKTEFNTLLRECNLTNFADLARQWRMRRAKSALARAIRLLCDRPDRLPKPPAPEREGDLLVAS
jgi:hypothetical protein